jgi:tripartite-type tricarboxylate transporter receptor subunit TctC
MIILLVLIKQIPRMAPNNQETRMNPSTLSRRHMLAALGGLSCAWLPARAQGYPDKPISLVVPNAAGGALDSLARSIADELGKRLKQNLVVENLGGASGAIAAQKVLRANPDGYTLLFGSSSDMVVTPAANRQAGYTTRDFTPIARMGITPMTLVARPGLNVNSVDELVALARKPGTSLSIGTTGNQSLQAFAAVALGRAMNVEFLHVPYKGGSLIINDMLGGQIDLSAMALPTAVAHVRSGKLKMLGLLSQQRSPVVPDFPTVNESQAVKDVVIEIWAALAAPGKLPPAIAEKLHAAAMDVLRDKEFSERRMKLGDMPAPQSSLSEFARFLAAEEARFASLAAGLK